MNDVNAPGIAAERGIDVAETRRSEARDFSDLVRVTVVSGSDRTRVVGTVLGSRHRPHLLEAWGSRFNVQLEQHLAVFRYTRPARDARPRGHDAGRREREHRLGRGRLEARRGRAARMP